MSDDDKYVVEDDEEAVEVEMQLVPTPSLWSVIAQANDSQLIMLIGMCYGAYEWGLGDLEAAASRLRETASGLAKSPKKL